MNKVFHFLLASHRFLFPLLLIICNVCFTFLTCVLWETDAECRLLNLLCEQILLVEEEDDGGVDEKLVVADGVEEHQRLVHAILLRRKERKGGNNEGMERE